jgi:1-acyl-sn-glycerol-3-phosphate acyltransferase
MKQERVYYYENLNTDDFAHNIGIKWNPLPKKMKWVHKGLLWNLLSYILYYGFAIPVLFIYTKIKFSLKVVGKKKLKRAHLKQGYFLYGNHTQEADGFIPQVFITNPKRTYVVCSQDVVCIKGIRGLVQMLGALPVSKTPLESQKFVDAIDYRHKRGDAILIFPEAHIWPYTTMIRDFPDTSFTYPASLNAPVVAYCSTYKERKFFRHRPPQLILHVSDPFYPDQSLPLGERAHALREQVYNYMVDVSSSLDNYEYVRYIKRDPATKKEEE